jgi:pectate lyase
MEILGGYMRRPAWITVFFKRTCILHLRAALLHCLVVLFTTSALSSLSAQPNFDLVGFATLNGGTTGGKGGQTVTVSSYNELKKYAQSSSSCIIMVNGTISNGNSGGKVSIGSNKSIIGIGSTAFLKGVGLEVASNNNVIIRNLKITLVGSSNPNKVNGGDCISIHGTSKNIWIDHCEIFSEPPHIQTNIDKYDGLIDIKHKTGFITVSWSYLHDHHKGCLIGSSETDLYADRKVTYHHNRFERVVKRMPMIRGSVGHFFNNYIIGAKNSSGKYVTEATFVLENVCLRVEKNVYEKVKYSIYTGKKKGRAERIDNIAPQSRAYPSSCTANIPYDYTYVLTKNKDDVKRVVPKYAGVGIIGSGNMTSMAPKVLCMPVSSKKNVHLSIFTLNGKKILFKDLHSHQKMHHVELLLANLRSGVYFLRYKFGSSLEKTRFVHIQK